MMAATTAATTATAPDSVGVKMPPMMPPMMTTGTSSAGMAFTKAMPQALASKWSLDLR